jgi:hypothetical protein
MTGCRRLTDAGTAALRACHSLESLLLYCCSNLTDETCRSVAALPNLRILALSQASKSPFDSPPPPRSQCKKITDEGLRHLGAGSPCLRKLELSSVKRISDAGVGHLLALSSLRNLNVHGCPLSPPALARLRAKPGLAKLVT